MSVFGLNKDLYTTICNKIDSLNSVKSYALLNEENELIFDPPVYRQRYGTVQNVLLNDLFKNHIKEVVEFGCAEFGMFTFLKNVPGLQSVNFVDINEELLKEKLFKLNPLIIDHVQVRSEPLSLKIFAGSIAEVDPRIKSSQAVIGIEIIEHLYPDTLEAVPYTIFGIIRPKIAIFTTPNYDFNVLLPNLRGFRHFDHKFEWSREQFQDWALNIVVRFPDYFPTFQGVGNGLKGSESYGCCTQMVVFIRKDLVVENYNLCHENVDFPFGICTYLSSSISLNNKEENYKLLDCIEYPFKVDNRSFEEKILDDLAYKISYKCSIHSNYYNEEKSRVEIPLAQLISTMTNGLLMSLEDAKKLLIENGYTIEKCPINNGENEELYCVIKEIEMEEFSSSLSATNKRKSEKLKRIKEANNANSLLKESLLRKQIRATILSECKFESILTSSDSIETASSNNANKNVAKIMRPLPDPNKVNELDCLNNRNQTKPFPFFSQLIMRTQIRNACKRIRRRKLQIQQQQQQEKLNLKNKNNTMSDSEDPLRLVKSIANVLLENALNKLKIKDSRSKLITDHLNEAEAGNIPSTSSKITESDDENDSTASQDVNFDSNSRPDLDEDNLEFTPLLNEFESVLNVSIGAKNPLDLNSLNGDVTEDATFPEWLLLILRRNFPNNTNENNEIIPIEGPHFYSQGDGLGVHPSLIPDNDEDTTDESDTSSYNDSLSLNELESEYSVILFEETRIATVTEANGEGNVQLCVIGSSINPEPSRSTVDNEESEEYFDTNEEMN